MRGRFFPSCPGAHTTLGFEGGRRQLRWTAAGKGLPVPLAPAWCWGCICCWVSALSPPQLRSCGTAALQNLSPSLCCVIASLCPPFALLCCSQPSWTGFGSLGSFHGCTSCPGLGLCVFNRGGEAGGMVGELCARAPPLLGPCPALAGPSRLWHPRKCRWWRRGCSVP